MFIHFFDILLLWFLERESSFDSYENYSRSVTRKNKNVRIFPSEEELLTSFQRIIRRGTTSTDNFVCPSVYVRMHVCNHVADDSCRLSEHLLFKWKKWKNKATFTSTPCGNSMQDVAIATIFDS